MAGVTHTFTNGVKVPGLPTLPADPPVVVTGDYAVEVEIDVPAGTVSLAVAVGTILKAKVISMVVNADKVAMDIFTNSANGAGGQHFALASNNSVAWNNTLDQTLFPNPVATDISEFFINNATAKPGIFRASFLLLS